MDSPARERVETAERGTPVAQWEVFLRGETDEPLRHVGSVAGETAADAHQHAATLFDRFAADLWLCPAEAVERYTTRSLAAAAGDDRPGGTGEHR